jgi:hypothetical protein
VDGTYTSFNLMMAEILVKNPKMERFCKRTVTEANKLDAVHLRNYQWTIEQEEEKKRKAAEAAADGDADP